MILILIIDICILATMIRKSTIALLLLLPFSPLSAFAGGDPDRGMSRALGIEEAWIENAVYLSSSRDNESTPGHTWNTGVEWDVAISRRWAAEIDAPGLLLADPPGNAALAMAPITLGLKYAAWQSGNDDSVNSGIVSMEVEGSWWPKSRPEAFPGIGSNMAEQVLVGLRHGNDLFQGEYGISQRLGTDARSGWFANSAIGRRLGDIWTVQMEVDVNHTSVRDSGATALGVALTPQLGVRIGQGWQLIFGETFSRVSGQSGYTSSSSAMFEYHFDTDADDEAGT
jgi:hypothetical protein